MIIQLWQRVDYTAQLICACLLFLHPVCKRAHYHLRVLCACSLMLAASFFINSIFPVPESGPWLFVYWGVFLLGCIPFIWGCVRVSLWEAVYCTVCVSATQHAAYDVYCIYHVLWGARRGDAPLVVLGIYAAVYLLFYRVFVRKLARQGGYSVSRSDLFPMTTILLFVWLLSIWEKSAEPALPHSLIYPISDALCCYYVLWQQASQREKMDLQRDLDGISHALRQQQLQFQLTQETIDTINRKCHDLRHQLWANCPSADGPEREAYLKSVEEAIQIYDTAVETGNSALDIVLMEKGRFCKSHDIQWTCLADGAQLSFMALEDIYALFGNALDNAIAAVMELDEPEKRVISVRVVTQGELLMIQVQNYFDHPLTFEDGLPRSTRTDGPGHGYGMKSIRYTAEKYGGTISVQTRQNIFTLQVLIPQP